MYIKYVRYEKAHERLTHQWLNPSRRQIDGADVVFTLMLEDGALHYAKQYDGLKKKYQSITGF